MFNAAPLLWRFFGISYDRIWELPADEFFVLDQHARAAYAQERRATEAPQ